MNRKSYLISGLITLLLIVWMGSGYLMRPSRGSQPETIHDRPQPNPMTVQVRDSVAEDVTRALESQGQTASNRQVQVRAETTGTVAEVLVEKGAVVATGDPLVRLNMSDRQARLDQAEAVLARRVADYEAVSALGDKGLQSSSQVREVYAALQSARAELAAIREDISHTTIRAPFDGVVNTRSADVGDYLAPGDAVARVVDNSPLKVVVHVAQQDIGAVQAAAEAEVILATGQKLSGTIDYISAVAEPQTRTFRIELNVANPGMLPAGVSATVRIPLETVRAHFLSPALLALNEKGVLGAKTVTADATVAFHPVEVVRAQTNGVWVSGLPDSARLITAGQGFVRAGEVVKTVESAAGDAFPERPQDATPMVDGTAG